jgi:hypothetical protein
MDVNVLLLPSSEQCILHDVAVAFASSYNIPYVTSQQNNSLRIGLEISEGATSVTIKITLFWNVISCTLIEAYRRFEGTSCYLLLCRIVRQK